MELVQLPPSISAFINRLPQQKMAQGLSAVLLIYVAFLFAQLTWLLVGSSPAELMANNTSRAMSNLANKEKITISKIQALNLFGVYNTQSVEKEIVVVSNVPETRLNLTLSGLVASDDEDVAAAIIENNGKQETYGIGEKINGTRASLEQVLMDRVIIKQSGRLETLMLDGFDFKKPAKAIATKKQTSGTAKSLSPQHSPSQVKRVDQRNNEKLTASATNLRNDLKKDPGKITDYLRIRPFRKDGKVLGYKLSPGKNPEFFKSSGLKSGDLAVQMNGNDLTVPLEAAKALQALRNEPDVSLLIERQGEYIEILFSVGG